MVCVGYWIVKDFFVNFFIYLDWMPSTLSLYLVFYDEHLFFYCFSTFFMDLSCNRNLFHLYVIIACWIISYSHQGSWVCEDYDLLYETWFHFQVARKLAMVEADLERAEERAESGESYVFRAVLLCVACFIYRECSAESVWIVVTSNSFCVSSA
jgi:hypothetical protein